MTKKRLIALVPILHENKQYKPGEVLPTDPAYASAWTQVGSAVWENEGDSGKKQDQKKATAKARSVTAPAGATGIAQPATGSAEADQVGKVPSKKARGVVEEKTKRPAKSQA